MRWIHKKLVPLAILTKSTTMKYALVILAVLGLTAGAPVKSLEDDINYIVSLIPIAQIREIIQQYASDPELVELLAFIRSDDWEKIHGAVVVSPAWLRFKAYLLDNGVDISEIRGIIVNAIQNASATNSKHTRSIDAMINDILNVLPPYLMTTIGHMIQHDPEFHDFWVVISSEGSHELFSEFRATPEVQRLICELENRGLYVNKAFDAMYGLFGWSP